MIEYSHGDSVTVQTDTINNGEPFDASVVHVSQSDDVVSVNPTDLDVVEMAIVGLSEVEER
jgi:hypothetical protein